MPSESYDLSGLPGPYNYDGFFCTVNVPKSDEKVRTKISYQHMAYDIILPRLAKEIFGNGYRKLIKEHIHGVCIAEDRETAECFSKEDSMPKENDISGWSRMAIVGTDGKLCVYPEYFSEALCAEAGHLLSIDVYQIPEINDIREYYDCLAQKIGEKLFSHSRFSYKLESIPELIVELLDDARNTDINDMDSDILEDRIEHFRGYLIAEIMHKTLGKDAFTDYRELFDIKNNKATLKDSFLNIMEADDRKQLADSLKKMDEMEKILESLSEIG